MAISATIFKVTLQVADMNRNYYADHMLTLARHPSETDERMMVRILAFALHGDEHLQFTKGLCEDDEPDLWQKSLTNEIKLWIDVGLPDERRVRKACNRADMVYLYLYGGRSANLWWQKNTAALQRCNNLKVIELPEEATQDLTRLVQRHMTLQCTIQDDEIWLSSGEATISVMQKHLKGRDD
jgi:uncharacterized protein YaeQ